MRDITNAYKTCPRCGHDWIAHFAMTDKRGEQVEPYTIPCMECTSDEDGGCDYATEMSQRGNNHDGFIEISNMRIHDDDVRGILEEHDMPHDEIEIRIQDGIVYEFADAMSEILMYRWGDALDAAYDQIIDEDDDDEDEDDDEDDE
jgi:hypothetical protein